MSAGEEYRVKVNDGDCDNPIRYWGTEKTLEEAQRVLYSRVLKFINGYPYGTARARAKETTTLVLERKISDGTFSEYCECEIISHSVIYQRDEPKITENCHAVDPQGLYPNDVAGTDRALQACLVARHSYNNQIKYLGYVPMVFKSFKIRIAVNGSGEFSFSGVTLPLTTESEVVFSNSAEPLCGHVLVNSNGTDRRVYVKANCSEFSRVIAVRGSKAYDLSKITEARDFINCPTVETKLDFLVEYFME